jgi:hypothetical protein
MICDIRNARKCGTTILDFAPDQEPESSLISSCWFNSLLCQSLETRFIVTIVKQRKETEVRIKANCNHVDFVADNCPFPYG